jgi:hypothetical protein
MSREQQAAYEWGAAMSELRSGIDGPPEALAALDALRETGLRFAACERRMRRAERLNAVGLHEAESATLVGLALADHERGLTALRPAREFAESLMAQDTDEQELLRWRESSTEIRSQWRHHVSELDLGSDDARHLIRIMDECCDSVDEHGINGIGRYLSRCLQDLEEARRSDDRGTRQGSFPWWKIVLAAIILGLTAWEVWTLLSRGAPWWNFFLVALVNCILMLLAVLAC